ncbi:MAG: NADH-ubiquinone oxidoreductase-F iron-sulfur binding region domain-containing protein [Candidatus Woesearchaeota archaeon]
MSRKDLEKITIGMATCGIASGADVVKKELEKQAKDILIEKVGCLGSCYLEPIVELRFKDKSLYFKQVNKEIIPKIISAIDNPEAVEKELLIDFEDPFFKKQVKLVTKNVGKIDPFSLEEYEKTGGFEGLKKAIENSPEQIIETIKTSKLRGRGGAGAPTSMKWTFIAKAEKPKYLICNADEGDPGAFMNRAILESDPFRLFEGMLIGAYATGCEQGIIYARAEYPLAIKTLENAIEQLKKKKLLGKNILGKFDFDIIIKKGAGAFVCGEETALMKSVEGRRGMPQTRPPYPAERGVYERPTNINNVGTFCHVATIFQIGVNEYIKYGTEKTGGTKIICIAGKADNAGVIEVPFGISLKEIIYDIAKAPANFKAVQCGGPSGGCIPKDKIDIPYDYETIQSLGAIVGSGGMIFMDSKNDMVDVARYFLNFTKEESCGKCIPCREGTFRLYELLERFLSHRVSEDDIDFAEKMCYYIKDSAVCGLGQTAPNPVLTTLKYFRNEYENYIIKDDFKTYFITQKCVGCDQCTTVCPQKCISGDKGKLHTIDQEKCIECGACYKQCKFDAIITRADDE